MRARPRRAVPRIAAGSPAGIAVRARMASVTKTGRKAGGHGSRVPGARRASARVDSARMDRARKDRAPSAGGLPTGIGDLRSNGRPSANGGHGAGRVPAPVSKRVATIDARVSDPMDLPRQGHVPSLDVLPTATGVLPSNDRSGNGLPLANAGHGAGRVPAPVSMLVATIDARISKGRVGRLTPGAVGPPRSEESAPRFARRSVGTTGASVHPLGRVRRVPSPRSARGPESPSPGRTQALLPRLPRRRVRMTRVTNTAPPPGRARAAMAVRAGDRRFGAGLSIDDPVGATTEGDLRRAVTGDVVPRKPALAPGARMRGHRRVPFASVRSERRCNGRRGSWRGPGRSGRQTGSCARR